MASSRSSLAPLYRLCVNTDLGLVVRTHIHFILALEFDRSLRCVSSK
jgi:hypothetical protein